MTSPHLGLGLAPPPADPSAAPPSRRAPRLAKRRHAATTSRSRAQPSTSTSTSAPWNPFLGGGTDASGQDGTGGSGSVAGGGGYEFGKGQKVGNVFGPAPAARRPPPAASNEAPFVFGSVRDSLPRFDVGSSAASKLDHKMGKLNLQSPGKCSVGAGKGVDQTEKSFVFGATIPSLVSSSEANVLPEKLTQLNIGTEVPLQNEGAKVGPKTFVFGSNGAVSFADSRSTASFCADSYASSSVQVTKANGTPESGHAESTSDATADYRAHDASVLQEKITQLNIGSGTFQYMKDGGSGSRQTEVLGFGDGRTAGTIFGNASSNTSDKGSIFFSFGNNNASISANGAANVPPERASNLNVGGGVKQSMKSDDTNCSPETFVFGRNGSTYSASEQSARVVMDDGDNSGSGASTSTCTSAHGTMGSTLPEKMTKLNIEQVIPSQSVKDEAATRQPEPFVFGSNATSSFSSLKTTSFTSFQTNVSSESKGSRGSLANDGSGSSVTILSEGTAEHALQDEIKKLNINKEGPSAGNVNASDACTPKFSFQSKVEAVPGYCTFPQPKVQESCPFTPSNHSSTYSTSANAMPSFSSSPPNGGSESAPGESCAVKQDPASCSRESLFGIDYIKSAYRDKKEAHRSTRKKKRPTRLKQHGQLHQVSQETCANGLASDLTGDYSPMDCSPYQATVEQVPREAFVSCDQSTDICDDLPMCQDEGRDPIADASESNFGSNFSSFDGEINFYDAPQPIFTNMNVDANGEPKMYTTEAWVDGSGCNVSGPTCEENTSRTPHESGEPVNIQSSSANLSRLNFTFGASLYPESSLPTQRHTTKRKLRTKVGQAPKPSATQASVQPKGSQDTKSMQFSPETSTTENSVKEQLRRDASVSADLETCETWRTSGNQAYANGHFATAEGCYTRGINSISQYATSGRCSHALMLCYSNRAATRMSLGRMREALQDCSIATSIDPTFLKAKVRAANCQLALGDLEGASNNYTACLKSSNTAYSDTKMFAEASNGLERVKRVADCISQSRELLKKRTLPDAETALDLISSALHISSHSDNLMEMKAEALLTLRRYEEVIELCQETADLAERNSVSINANGEPNISSVPEKAECSATLWRPYLIGKSYFLLGKLEESLDLLKRHEPATPAEESDGSTRKCFSSLSTSIRKLLSFKAAGNESFQARRYSEAVEQYSAALAYNSDSRPFSAVCFCNRAAAYQALGQLTDAIADCSLAMVLDANYPKAISRRATLYEMIRDYGQSANDLRKLISLLQKQANKPGVSPKVFNKHSDLKQARARLLSAEDEARKDTPLNFYLILGVEPSCSPADVKKAYRKAALRHHPDKATQLLVRNENADDGFWRDVAKEVYADADHLFKTIGEAYNILSDPDKREEYDIEENIRNASRRAYKGRSTPRSPEQHYRRHYDGGFNPRHWQSAGQSNKGAPRSRWSGYEYSDDYW
ncbi:uncharacterized protein LOC125514940 isoform X2 [Triticum urartu]|uniref:uncharacterized protein LOC125514940 isoform X2 n=1 Tax=Triticum urartu TaxID=4572 RepID=UPI002043FB40|nr:uncharacterized protein LOC125514940 isoform X2 [Triticum urartu]